MRQWNLDDIIRGPEDPEHPLDDNQLGPLCKEGNDRPLPSNWADAGGNARPEGTCMYQSLIEEKEQELRELTAWLTERAECRDRAINKGKPKKTRHRKHR